MRKYLLVPTLLAMLSSCGHGSSTLPRETTPCVSPISASTASGRLEDFLLQEGDSLMRVNKILMMEAMNEFIRNEYGFYNGGAFCGLGDDEEKGRGLVVSKKTSFNTEDNPLHMSYVATDAEIEEKAEEYPESEYDTYQYSLYTTESGISERILGLSHAKIAELFFHERFHDEINLSRIVEESMARYFSHIAAIAFFESYLARPQWTQYRENAIKELRRYLDRAQIIPKVYHDLQALYASSLSEKEKLERREAHFQRIKDELGDGVVNNATIAREVFYLIHLNELHDIHHATGADVKNTLAFYRSIPEQTDKANIVLSDLFLQATRILGSDAIETSSAR